MNNIIQQIMNHENLEEIFDYVKYSLFQEGPISITTLEIISYLNLFASDSFSHINNEILSMMGVYYKRAQGNHTFLDTCLNLPKEMWQLLFHQEHSLTSTMIK